MKDALRLVVMPQQSVSVFVLHCFIQYEDTNIYTSNIILFFLLPYFLLFAHVAAAICLGSFGVPVKSEVVKRLDVDPLVVQVSIIFI